MHKSRTWALPGRKSVLAAVVCAMLAASSCASDAQDKESPAAGESDDTRESHLVLATTGIWADVVQNIACGDDMSNVQIETIIPVGGDAHGFEPSLADRERMENADLIVANGLWLEEGLESTMKAVEDLGVPVFRVGDHINTIEFAFEGDHHGEEEEGDEEGDHGEEDEGDEEGDHGEEDEGDEEGDHGEEDEGDEEGDHGEEEDHHEAGGPDPHVWFDPTRVSAALPGLADLLIAKVGLPEAVVEDCLMDYRVELEELDAKLVELLAGVPEESRKLVTNHDSLGYFADRYGFEVVASIIPMATTMAETNPARLEELAEHIEEAGVKAIFAESVYSTDDADALAARVGDVEVVSLFTGSLGPEGSGAETYTGFMRTNAKRIADALG